MRQLVDSFLFNGELDLLELRFRQLKEAVNYFVIVEADRTFTGLTKHTHQFEVEELAHKCGVKVIYHLYTQERYNNDTWKNETALRNQILVPLKSFLDDTLVLFSDCDEIPNIESLPDIAHFEVLALEQLFFYYGFNLQVMGYWYGTRFLTLKSLRFYSPANVRKLSTKSIPEGGYHCSYFGNPETIANKIRSFSHTEYNLPEFTDTAKIYERISSGIDIFEREEMQLRPLYGISHCPSWVIENYDNPEHKDLIGRLFV